MQRVNPKLFSNMFEQISLPNRMYMKLLLTQGRVSYYQLRSGLTELLCKLYHTPIESSIFHTVLNSHITCYLQAVSYGSGWFNFVSEHLFEPSNLSHLVLDMPQDIPCQIPIEIVKTDSALSKVRGPIYENSTVRLTKSFDHKPESIDADHQRMIGNSQCIENPVKEEDTKSEDALTPRKNDKQIFVVNDLDSFLSPLEEDYTKSSKGYIGQNKFLNDKMKLPGTHDVLHEHSFSSMIMYNDDSSESSLADDENYDPVHDTIISRYLAALKNITNDSEINNNSYSDSDDSIVFAEEFGEDIPESSISFKCGIGNSDKKIQFCMSVSSDSDEDDSISFNDSFSERFFKASNTKLNSWSEIDEFDAISSDSDSFEECNKNSSPLFQSFSKSFSKDFSSASYSLSHGKIHIYTKELDGFVNPCFVDDDLRNVNNKWENTMQDVSSEPREPKKVSFLPMPGLVSVKTYEPDEDRYCYGLYLLDQLRFKNRIEEFEQIMKPYLSADHRENVYQYYYSSDN